MLLFSTPSSSPSPPLPHLPLKRALMLQECDCAEHHVTRSPSLFHPAPPFLEPPILVFLCVCAPPPSYLLNHRSALSDGCSQYRLAHCYCWIQQICSEAPPAAVTRCAESSICATEYRWWTKFYQNAAAEQQTGGAPAAKKEFRNHSSANQLSPCLNTASDKNTQTVLHFKSYYPNSNLSDWFLIKKAKQTHNWRNTRYLAHPDLASQNSAVSSLLSSNNLTEE